MILIEYQAIHNTRKLQTDHLANNIIEDVSDQGSETIFILFFQLNRLLLY